MITVLAAESTSKIPGADIHADPWLWGVFGGIVALLLILDLVVFHREARNISPREAAWSTAFWVSIGLGFCLLVWGALGSSAAAQYLAGYMIEYSLSVDNVFVWAVIFTYFAVPAHYRHRTLFWGIFGAIVLRATFIFAGVALLEAVDWIIYVFGAFLLITAVRIARHKEGEVHPEKNPVLRLVRRVVPSTSEYRGQKFFVRENGRRLATPLFAVLVLVEATDVVFAVDSIPAILAISRSQFIVLSSNAFAILGLRSLYFLLGSMADRFIYLNQGLGVILAFVGVKMLLADVYHMPTWLSLGVIAVVLAVTVVASLRATAGQETPPSPAEEQAREAAADEHHD